MILLYQLRNVIILAVADWYAGPLCLFGAAAVLLWLSITSIFSAPLSLVQIAVIAGATYCMTPEDP